MLTLWMCMISILFKHHEGRPFKAVNFFNSLSGQPIFDDYLYEH